MHDAIQFMRFNNEQIHVANVLSPIELFFHFNIIIIYVTFQMWLRVLRTLCTLNIQNKCKLHCIFEVPANTRVLLSRLWRTFVLEWPNVLVILFKGRQLLHLTSKCLLMCMYKQCSSEMCKVIMCIIYSMMWTMCSPLDFVPFNKCVRFLFIKVNACTQSCVIFFTCITYCIALSRFVVVGAYSVVYQNNF